MCLLFPAWRPALLRDHVLVHSRGACLEAAVACFAADKDPGCCLLPISSTLLL